MGGTHTVFPSHLPSPPKSPEPTKRPLLNGTTPTAKRVKLDSDDEERDSTSSREQTRKQNKAARRQKKEVLHSQRIQLPIWSGKDAILKAVEDNDAVVILGETGSGKTTQVPQFLLDHNIPKEKPSIAVTQPRRVAATSLASRVAEEAGVALGSLVGYTVRFDDVSSANTRLKFVTDGTLLQEMLSDRLLSKYDIIIVDEAHERSMRTDMTLGFLKQIQQERNSPNVQTEPDVPLTKLKVIVMSATLDAERFSTFFNGAPVLYVKGRQHKVELQYCKEAQQDYVEAALKTIFQLHMGPPGDVLVFLTGEDEIESLAAQIALYVDSLPPNKSKLVIHKLYSKLPPKMQTEAFKLAGPNTRKVILSTNIAETSITIPGVRIVVDTGMMKEKKYHSILSVDSLLPKAISKSAAQQRAGRAGREGPGKCIRLYSEAGFRTFDENQTPEILRGNLDTALLHLLASGVADVRTFPLMDRPDEATLRDALMHLLALKAIDQANKLTEEGRLMARFPLEPHFSRILLASFALGCPTEITSLLAMLEQADKILSVPAAARDDALEKRAPYADRSGDHITLLRLLQGYEQAKEAGGEPEAKDFLKTIHIAPRVMANVLEARSQIRSRCERMGFDWKVGAGVEAGRERILQACAAGLVLNTALRRTDGVYRKTTGNSEIKIHPSSVLAGHRPAAIMFSELTFTTSIYARTVSEIQPQWLIEHGGGVFGRRES